MYLAAGPGGEGKGAILGIDSKIDRHQEYLVASVLYVDATGAISITHALMVSKSCRN